LVALACALVQRRFQGLAEGVVLSQRRRCDEFTKTEGC
jgi:hypothetical protein